MNAMSPAAPSTASKTERDATARVAKSLADRFALSVLGSSNDESDNLVARTVAELREAMVTPLEFPVVLG